MSIAVAVPPRSEQDQIMKKVTARTGQLHAAITHAHRQIDLLHEYRTRLITDVVTGKLDVREAAAQLGEQPDGEDRIDEAIPMAHGMDEDPMMPIILKKSRQSKAR